MPVCDAHDFQFECSGEVKKYDVTDKGGVHTKWGTFHYCEAHAQEDRDRGFDVIEVDSQK